MSLRRLHHEQPESFAFTPANAEWAATQIAKYPPGRQASAVIALLWRVQEQEGWISRPAIETVAGMLDMAEIRVLEVATFYFMFQLRPMGEIAHVQVCGTTPCMLCGAEELVAVCKEKIGAKPYTRSPDGKFTWEEVECLGACANAPMAQIGKDYYEDLTAESFAAILDAFARGEVPRPGSQTGRFASEPAGGLTSLETDRAHEVNASVALALEIGDTVKRIDGTEPTASDLLLGRAAPTEGPPQPDGPPPRREPETDDRGEGEPDRAETLKPKDEIKGRPERTDEAAELQDEDTLAPAEREGPAPAVDEHETLASAGQRPMLYDSAPDGEPDDLTQLRGIGPKLESQLNELGVWRFSQIATWTGANLDWLDSQRSGLKKLAMRHDWVMGAKALAAGKGDA